MDAEIEARIFFRIFNLARKIGGYLFLALLAFAIPIAVVEELKVEVQLYQYGQKTEATIIEAERAPSQDRFINYVYEAGSTYQTREKVNLYIWDQYSEATTIPIRYDTKEPSFSHIVGNYGFGLLWSVTYVGLLTFAYALRLIIKLFSSSEPLGDTPTSK
jgi:hypothetical protein